MNKSVAFDKDIVQNQTHEFSINNTETIDHWKKVVADPPSSQMVRYEGMQHECPRGLQVQAAATLFQTQRPTSTPERAVDEGPTAWAPVTRTGDSDGIPGPWAQPGPHFACVAIR